MASDWLAAMLPANQMPGWPQNMNLTNWMLDCLEKTPNSSQTALTNSWLNQFSKHLDFHTSTHWAPGSKNFPPFWFLSISSVILSFLCQKNAIGFYILQHFNSCKECCEIWLSLVTTSFWSQWTVLGKYCGSPQMQVPHPTHKSWK